MSNIHKKGLVAGAAIMAVITLTASSCDEEGSDSKNLSKSHEKMQKNQPAKNMDHSPTRETINFWVETWDEPGKLSYVYLQNNEGDMLGYYVLEGLPVSYCAQISPNYKTKGDSGRVVVPAPANDGAYYGEGSCDTYYGKDATTGSYIEYTAGMGINVLLFDQPLPNTNGMNSLGKTSLKDVPEKDRTSSNDKKSKDDKDD